MPANPKFDQGTEARGGDARFVKVSVPLSARQ